MNQNSFLELLSLIAFFVAYYLSRNIFLATAICIIVSWATIFYAKYKYKKIAATAWISTILITVFGGLTIILHNKTFVMLKPTVLYWLFGFSMLISQLLGKNLLSLALNKHISLPAHFWQKLNLIWASFFIIMGVLNLYIAFHYSEYIWVKFKLIAGIVLSIILALTSAIMIMRAGRQLPKHDK